MGVLRSKKPRFVCDSLGASAAESKERSAAPEKEKAPAGEHGHKAGQHGGSIVEIGRDNYHAEATFGEKGLVRLYLLAKDEAQIQEVEQQTLGVTATAAP